MSWLKRKNTTKETDEQLLLRYKLSGDLEVLGQLYQRYMPMVYGLCLKYLHNEELSKDAVMQIFEELIDKAKKHEVAQFRSWLYVLSRNYCLMHLRRTSKNEAINIDNVMESAFILHPDENEHKEAHFQLLEHCLEKLAPAQKESINLFYLDNKCYKEIAETTGYSLNDVKSYIQNGKRNLKICFDRNSEK